MPELIRTRRTFPPCRPGNLTSDLPRSCHDREMSHGETKRHQSFMVTSRFQWYKSCMKSCWKISSFSSIKSCWKSQKWTQQSQQFNSNLLRSKIPSSAKIPVRRSERGSLDWKPNCRHLQTLQWRDPPGLHGWQNPCGKSSPVMITQGFSSHVCCQI